MTPTELAQQIADFIEHRESLKRSMAAIAIRRLEARAARMLDKGVDLVEAFDRAILAGWQSIYPPRNTDAPKQQSHKEVVIPQWEAGDKKVAQINIAALRRIAK